jgi:uncharacterized membrane protein YuzA (DUF378 family)
MIRTIHMIATGIVVLGALNWLGIGVLGVNGVARVFGARSITTRAIYCLVGLSAVAIMFHRDTYLPFLGETVFPCSAIPEQIPEGADTQVQVKVHPGAKVIYWAAEESNEGMKQLNDWRKAYLKFLNVGVVKADEKGIATLMVRNPQPYTVSWMGRLEPHVHFRECGDNGMVGRIFTVYTSSGRVEQFLSI